MGNQRWRSEDFDSGRLSFWLNYRVRLVLGVGFFTAGKPTPLFLIVYPP